MTKFATEALQLGYGSTVAYLKSLEESGRIHHAYLLVGEEGGAQDQLAEYWAKQLVGISGPSVVDPNLLTVRAGQDERITVATAREIRSHLVRSAGQGKRRVVVIEQAERCTEQAANALLKVLEEPRANSLTLLTSSAPERLPATLRSRLHRLSVPLLSSAATRELIRAFGTDLAEAKVEELVHLADGRFERLLALLGAPGKSELLMQATFWVDFLEAETAERDAMVQQRFALKSKNREALHQLGESLEVLELVIHDTFLLSTRSGHSTVFQPLVERLQRLADWWGHRQIALRLAVVERLREMYARKVSKKTLLDYLIIRL